MARSTESKQLSNVVEMSGLALFYQALHVRDYEQARLLLSDEVTCYQDPATGNTALHLLCCRLAEELGLDERIECLQFVYDLATETSCAGVNYTNEQGKTAVFIALELAATEADDQQSAWHGLCAAKILSDLASAQLEGGEWLSDRQLLRLSATKQAVFNDYMSPFIGTHLLQLSIEQSEAVLTKLGFDAQDSDALSVYRDDGVVDEPVVTCPTFLMPRGEHMRYSLFGDVERPSYDTEQRRLLSDLKDRLVTP